MGTRSFIAKIDYEGAGLVSYCHWDGYPSHHAPILLGNYQSEEQVDELLSLGMLSSLGERIGEPLNAPENEGDAWNSEVYRQRVNTDPTTCLAYYRDRREPWDDCMPRSFAGGTEAIRTGELNAADWWIEWVYVWTPDGWLFCETHEQAPYDLLPLAAWEQHPRRDG